MDGSRRPDRAFLVAAGRLGVADACGARFSRVAAIPFSSERKLMGVIVRDTDRDGQLTVVTKGPTDVLLDRCTYEQVGAGREELADI